MHRAPVVFLDKYSTFQHNPDVVCKHCVSVNSNSPSRKYVTACYVVGYSLVMLDGLVSICIYLHQYILHRDNG